MITIKQTEPTWLLVTGLALKEAEPVLAEIKKWFDESPSESKIIAFPQTAIVHLFDPNWESHKFVLDSGFIYYKPTELRLFHSESNVPPGPGTEFLG